MNSIKVNINKEEGEIPIYNNGKGIPIEIHKDEDVWVPELIFRHPQIMTIVRRKLLVVAMVTVLNWRTSLVRNSLWKQSILLLARNIAKYLRTICP